MDTKSSITLYHANCNDGLLAVSVWYHHYPQGSFVPVQYRRVPDLHEKYEKVTFLDFSPSADWVKDNLENIGELTIVDHHKSAEGDIEAIRALLPDAKIVFDINFSGGALTWGYLENTPLPPLAQIAADFDLGLPLDDKEGFIDIFAHWLEGDDELRFTDFYHYITLTDPVGLEIEYQRCQLVNQLREQKMRWFEQKLKYHKAKLDWLEGHPEIQIAYTFCPHYLITSFSKYIVKTNPLINIVVGVSISDKSLGFSFRGRRGEDFARKIAERFGGGGHDSAAGGYLNDVVGFYKLNQLIEKGGQVT